MWLLLLAWTVLSTFMVVFEMQYLQLSRPVCWKGCLKLSFASVVMFNQWNCVGGWNVCCLFRSWVNDYGIGLFCVGIRHVRSSGMLFCGALCPVIMWWALSKLGFSARKLLSSNFSESRVSIILSCSMFKADQFDADMSGVFSVFPLQSLWTGFWTSLSGPCPSEAVIDLTSIATLGITIFSIADQINLLPWMFDSHNIASNRFSNFCRL